MNLARPEPHMNIKQTVLIVCEGKKLIKEDLFDLMSAVDNKTKQRRVNMAITRARRNHKSFSNDNITPAKSESSTTVYELVEVMLKYI